MRKDPHGTKAEARRPDRDVRPCLHSFCAGACGLHGFQQRRASAALDGFGLAAAGRSLLRDYDDVDRMLPDRDRLAASRIELAGVTRSG